MPAGSFVAAPGNAGSFVAGTGSAIRDSGAGRARFQTEPGSVVRTRSVPARSFTPQPRRQRLSTARSPPVPAPEVKWNTVAQPPAPKSQPVPQMKWNLRKLQYNLTRGVPPSGRHLFTMQ